MEQWAIYLICKKTPHWSKILTNYFDDNQLCNANIALRFDLFLFIFHCLGWKVYDIFTSTFKSSNNPFQNLDVN
jgi:hypothetical protein